MKHSIRVRIIFLCIGLAVGSLLAAGLILAGLTHFTDTPPSMQTLAAVMLITAAAAAGIAAALGALTARRILQSIQRMIATAEAIAEGDLTPRVAIVSDDEIGLLAGAFNHMARVLRGRIGTLERRAAEQTKALSTFREISHLSARLEKTQLATEVVEKVRNSFHYYHAQIYFYDETGENLVLSGGTGEAGQELLADGHTIPKGAGPAGRAAESNTPVLVADTARDPDWRPNPLLPKTKSEVAVPIAAGERVLGVLDVQQNIAFGLSQADVDLLQSIASQVALAVGKARAYTPDRQQAEREALTASICQKIRETTTAETALQAAALELGRALGPKEARVVITASLQASRSETELDGGK
jgi:nitrate/nitrite-specific signal transduction histidine kinase